MLELSQPRGHAGLPGGQAASTGMGPEDCGGGGGQSGREMEWLVATCRDGTFQLPENWGPAAAGGGTALGPGLEPLVPQSAHL